MLTRPRERAVRGESNHRLFRNVVPPPWKKRKEKEEEKKATSTLSDTLPFEDHSATDRKGVPLDFTASSPLPARTVTCSRYGLLVLHTGDPSLREFSFHFPSFRSYFPVDLLSSPPLGLPRLGVPCSREELYVIMISSGALAL